jgi:flagellar biosynthesis protein FliR
LKYDIGVVVGLFVAVVFNERCVLQFSVVVIRLLVELDFGTVRKYACQIPVYALILPIPNYRSWVRAEKITVK